MTISKKRLAEIAAIKDEDIDYSDIPEWTDKDFARAKPFREVFPEQYKTWKKMGRPPVETPKVHIGFRLAADVVNGIKATGRAAVPALLI